VNAYRVKAPYGSCGWQVKLCDALVSRPYQSERFRGEVHDEALYKSDILYFTLLYFVASLLTYCLRNKTSGGSRGDAGDAAASPSVRTKNF